MPILTLPALMVSLYLAQPLQKSAGQKSRQSLLNSGRSIEDLGNDPRVKRLSTLKLPAMPSTKSRLATLAEIGQSGSSALATLHLSPTHGYDTRGAVNVINAGISGWRLEETPLWLFGKWWSGSDDGLLMIHLKPPSGARFLVVSIVGACDGDGSATLAISNDDQSYEFPLPSDVFTISQPILLKSNEVDIYVNNNMSSSTTIYTLAVDFV